MRLKAKAKVGICAHWFLLGVGRYIYNGYGVGVRLQTDVMVVIRGFLNNTCLKASLGEGPYQCMQNDYIYLSIIFYS